MQSAPHPGWDPYTKTASIESLAAQALGELCMNSAMQFCAAAVPAVHPKAYLEHVLCLVQPSGAAKPSFCCLSLLFPFRRFCRLFLSFSCFLTPLGLTLQDSAWQSIEQLGVSQAESLKTGYSQPQSQQDSTALRQSGPCTPPREIIPLE